MHSLNHAVLGHTVANERAGRPIAVRKSRGAPSARPIPRSGAASRSRPAAWRAAWTTRWPGAPSSDPCSAGSPHAAPPIPSFAVQRVRLEDRESFITADGSSIRELAGIPSGNAINQSLAEATVPPGWRDRRAFPPHLGGDLLLRRRRRPHAARRGRGRRPRGRHGRHRPRAAAQALQPRRGAARPALLLRAPVLRRGHRPSVRVGPGGAAAVAVHHGGRAGQDHRPLIGIGEQHPEIFSDEAFAPLGIKDVRFIAS